MSDLFKAKLGEVENLEDLAALPKMCIGNIDPQADNNARASFAAKALTTYTSIVGDTEDLETQISDLLGDLRHLCDALGVDYGEAAEHALYHYCYEIRGEL